MNRIKVRFIDGPFKIGTLERVPLVSTWAKHVTSKGEDEGYGEPYDWEPCSWEFGWSFLVIDRADQKLKIMDCCETIFNNLSDFLANFDFPPTSAKAPDFLVEPKKRTRYGQPGPLDKYPDFDYFHYDVNLISMGREYSPQEVLAIGRFDWKNVSFMPPPADNSGCRLYEPIKCEHAWIDVGFKMPKWVCSKCDCDKSV